LRFEGYVLSKSTLSEVYKRKGEPRYFDKMGKYTRIVYIENIFEREGAVIYDFYENVLIA